MEFETASLRPDLFQDAKGLFFAPIRHHSPACAWALRAMIRDIKPAHVLIEAPADQQDKIDLLLDPLTVPPVALLSVSDGEDRIAAYYPFTDHSPEYVALTEAAKIGASTEFIDLPASSRNQDRPNALHPIVQNEMQFDSGDYIRALCQKLSCRDGFELWDHLFEARLGTADWRSFFSDCGVYCAGIRAATSPEQIDATGDAARERHMSDRVANRLETACGPVVVVIGGFHAPALTTPQLSPQPHVSNGKSYLIRYGYKAMDALAGYGAGLPQPGYYDRIWQGAMHAEGQPDWQDVNADLLSDFDQWMERKGQKLSLPAKVEALRLSSGLAALRGRDSVLRHDLLDGISTSFVKGERGVADIWSERLRDYLRGTKLGDVPPSAGSPPLIEDIRRRARTHRFDLSDGAERNRKLDIRRKKPQRRASQFLHALNLLDCGFARRSAGPDFVQRERTELLFEEWAYAWSPSVEALLVEHAAYADKLPDACLAKLDAARFALAEEGAARDLPVLVELLLKGILAGLDGSLTKFLNQICDDIQTYGTFEAVAWCLRQFHFVANASGPLQVSDDLDVPKAEQVIFEHLIYLCDDLPKSNEDTIPDRLDALRVMNEVLAADNEGRLDRSRYDATLMRVVEQQPPPEILGAILACMVLADVTPSTTLADGLRGNFSGVVLNQQDRIAFLRGLLTTAPQLLWQRPDVLTEVDVFLASLDEDAFIAVLPHLRQAFTALNPRETDRLADMIGALHDVEGHSLSASSMTFSEQDLQQAIAANAAVRAGLISDGLEGWIGS